MAGRFPIEDVTPCVACGRYPAKAVVGELVPISAVSYREGHAALGANVVWQGPDGRARPFTRMTPGEPGTDRWHAAIKPDLVGRWTFTVEAFGDPYVAWRDAVTKKIAGGQGAEDLANDLVEGADILDQAEKIVPVESQPEVGRAIEALRADDLPLFERVSPGLDLAELLWEYPVRELVTSTSTHALWVDRKRALFSAWYEFFPRSEGSAVGPHGEPGTHGTFATAAQRLRGVADMGFDILYLPPIHPIGRVNRKGRNNTLVPTADDPGSPWAIGSEEGGHKAIHPALGKPADFRHLVAGARELGIEVALDIALQCAPDHPYVKKHPEWFRRRPDGSVQYAENPPKKYEDIYPFNFATTHWSTLWDEVKSIFEHWIEQGVRVFRVDNPHTKPFALWEWLIAEIKRERPDVIFLSEAFTRPRAMHRLAKLGFSQSYTYFTWRNGKAELTEYFIELTAGEGREYFRPNVWPNTPDILHEYLQLGGRPAFMTRLVLAATLCANYGIYGPPFELCENKPRQPGSEEYLDSEKYQIKHRDLDRPDGLKDFITRVNAARRDNPALHFDWNLRFHSIDNDQLICYSKVTRERTDAMLMVVNLDWEHTQSGWVDLNLEELGVAGGEAFQVHDLLSDARYLWHGSRNYVELNPHICAAHVFRLRRHDRTERQFEYFA